MAQHTATATATTERSCTGFRGQTLAPARFASRGGAGDDHSGDARANSLTGFGGADVLEGGGGDDSIDAALQDAVASTARADNVTCGTGNDRVMADANDTYRIDCERIRVGLAGGPEPRSTSAPRERAARVP